MTDPTDPSPTSTARPDEEPPADGDPPEEQEVAAVEERVETGDEAVVADVDVTQPEPAAEVEPVADVERGPAADEGGQAEEAMPADGEAEPVVELPSAGSGDLEWQPVYSGDQISWQPVVASETDESWSETEPPAAEWEGETGTEMLDYEAAAGADWGVPEDEPGDEAGIGGLVPPERPKGPSAAVKKRRMVVLLSVLTGVVLIVIIGAFVFGQSTINQATGGPDPTTPPTSAGAATPATLPPGLLETFTDDLTGLSVKYPKAWVRSGSPVADVRLTVSGEGRQLMRIRVLPIEVPATPENIENYKTVTDGIVFSDPNNKLVQQRLIQLNGRLAYYYLYTYADAPTGQQGVHAHYFIFEGKRMFTMVLQAAPVEEFQRLAGVYDQIAESFTVPEERFAPGATTTTTAPATTTTSTP